MLGELLAARYKVIDVLGSGGFGHTYIAEDTQRPGHPRCVLKHLTFANPNPAVLQQVRRLFQAEAETLEKLGRHDQIPRLLAYFEISQEFYLVQEFVEGHPLSDELAGETHFTETQVIQLLEDVLGILEYVHAQGVIHRDIKPDNLIRRKSDQKLVLIDFGAVKTIGDTVAQPPGETNLSVPIYTSGYGASEQCLGRPQFSSDLYSLGMVAIQALTGLRPSQLPQDYNTGEIIWRDQVQISEALAAVLEKMSCYHFNQRYRSATEALQALHQISPDAAPMPVAPPGPAHPLPELLTLETPTPSPSALQDQHRHRRRSGKSFRWLLFGLGGVGLAGAAIALLMQHFPSGILSPTPSPLASPSEDPELKGLQERISTGERLLNRWQTFPNQATKQKGIEQLAAGDYGGAVKTLEVARQQAQADPETLIYLNNARIGAAKSYTIAISVPLGDISGPALELLRGAAQVQDSVNRAGGIQGVPLKLAIVNDDNNPTVAKALAKVLAGNLEVLGVIGHSISDTSIAAAEVYQANHLVMISPLSSAVQLSNIGSYIFRTMPSDRVAAKTLANYMLNRLKRRKVVVFFNSASAYSQSLRTEFKDALFYNGVDLLQEFDFARPDFDADENVTQAIAKGAEVLMLAPDYRTSNQAIQVVQVNQQRLKLLAGESMYSPKVLKVAGKDAVGMAVAVPADLTHSAFQQTFQQLWGRTVTPGWRTALAYDATEAFVAALRSDPSRSGIQRILSQLNFSVPGAEGKVSFLPSGDRQGEVQLMTVAPVKAGSKTIYEFHSLTGTR